jgi:hypothetical protein
LSSDNRLISDELPIEVLAVRPHVAARAIGVSLRKMDRLINEGQIECAREGRTTMVLVKSLQQFLEINRMSPRATSAARVAESPPVPDAFVSSPGKHRPQRQTRKEQV